MNRPKTSYYRVRVLKLTISVVILLSLTLTFLTAVLNEAYKGFAVTQTIFQFLLNTTVTFVILSFESLIIYIIIFASSKLPSQRLPIWLRVGFEIFACGFFTFWMLYTVYLLTIQPDDKLIFVLSKEVGFREFIGGNLMGMLFVYLYISALLLHQSELMKEQEAELRKRQYADVQLQALKNQVNPHFLFNSLSVLSSLVHVNANQSEKFILQLSKAYRYLLDHQEKTLVTLRSELEFLDAYFYLLQIRFEDKIQLNVNISADADSSCLPPLTLQLLVENVIKHNKMGAEIPLRITVTNDEKKLIVRNTLNRRENQESSTGVGLENIKNRYRMLTKEQVFVKQESSIFEIQLPLIKC